MSYVLSIIITSVTAGVSMLLAASWCDDVFAHCRFGSYEFDAAAEQTADDLLHVMLDTELRDIVQSSLDDYVTSYLSKAAVYDVAVDLVTEVIEDHFARGVVRIRTVAWCVIAMCSGVARSLTASWGTYSYRTWWNRSCCIMLICTRTCLEATSYALEHFQKCDVMSATLLFRTKT